MLIFSKASRLYCRWSASNYLSGLSIGCNAWLRTRHYRAIGFGTFKGLEIRLGAIVSECAMLFPCWEIMSAWLQEKWLCQASSVSARSRDVCSEITRCHARSRDVTACHGIISALSRPVLGMFTACSRHVTAWSRYLSRHVTASSRHVTASSRHVTALSRHVTALSRPLETTHC